MHGRFFFSFLLFFVSLSENCRLIWQLGQPFFLDTLVVIAAISVLFLWHATPSGWYIAWSWLDRLIRIMSIAIPLSVIVISIKHITQLSLVYL